MAREDDPTTIALIPKAAPVRKPSGGYDYIYDEDNPATPKTEQTFKIIPTGGGWSNTIVETDSGFSTRSDYVIVGSYDADIDAGDYWVDGNTTYTVNDIIAKMIMRSKPTLPLLERTSIMANIKNSSLIMAT